MERITEQFLGPHIDVQNRSRIDIMQKNRIVNTIENSAETEFTFARSPRSRLLLSESAIDHHIKKPRREKDEKPAFDGL